MLLKAQESQWNKFSTERWESNFIFWLKFRQTTLEETDPGQQGTSINAAISQEVSALVQANDNGGLAWMMAGEIDGAPKVMTD